MGLRSHMNAIRAIDEGRFKNEVVFPSRCPTARSSRSTSTAPHLLAREAGQPAAAHPFDEGARRPRQRLGPERRAAALVLTSREFAARRGPDALGRHPRVGFGLADPGRRTGLSPGTPSARRGKGGGSSSPRSTRGRSTRRSPRSTVAAVKALGSIRHVNVNGSGCSLGHPIGCTGARIDRHHAERARAHRRPLRRRRHVRRGRHGSASVIEPGLSTTSPPPHNRTRQNRPEKTGRFGAFAFRGTTGSQDRSTADPAVRAPGSSRSRRASRPAWPGA